MNILVIQLRQLGDVLLTTPVANVLKDRFPDSKITFLTEENAYDILSGNPNIDNIIAMKRKQTLLEQLNVILDIRKRRFDLVIDYMSNPRTAYITFFSGAKVTIGYAYRFRRHFYKVAAEPKGDYASDYKLSVLSILGISSKDNIPYINVPQVATEKISSYLRSVGVEEDDFLVCMDATHRRVTRKWTGKGFAEVADRLKEEYNAKVLFMWGPGEREEVEQIMGMCRHRHLISPGTEIKELAALLKRADMLIGNCSFPRHVAVSQGTPTLVILGATGEGWTYPLSIHQTVKKELPCQPCDKIVCSDLSCLTTLTADEVMTEFKRLLPAIKGAKTIVGSMEGA